MNTRKLLTVLKGSGGGLQAQPMQFTVTTTGAQTATIANLGVISGKTVTIDWGDGTIESFTTTASRAHAYAGAGTWSVKVGPRNAINRIDLYDNKFSGTISATNPWPSGVTSLYLYNLSGLTWNANTTPMPSGVTSLTLRSLSGFTWNANTTPMPSGVTSLTLWDLSGLTWNANTTPMPSGVTSLALCYLSGFTWNANTTPMPSGVTSLYLWYLSGFTWNANTTPIPSGVTSLTLWDLSGLTWNGTLPNGIRTATVQNSASQATVDSWLYAVLSNKANFTYATPSLNLAGTNAAPSGTYQAADPVTSGQEAKYALVMGNGSYAPGPEWTVTTN